MTGALSGPFGQYTEPGLSVPTDQLFTTRGLCSLSFEGNTLNFRTNPNEVWWDYSLITHIENTYGGRVVQILGVKLDNLTVKVDCGGGGWPYAMQVVQFMRDLMVTQRDGNSATFLYTTRNWRLKVYALNVPFLDQVTSTVRELELEFKIQEDVTGITTNNALIDAVTLFADGIGWAQSLYNNIDGAAQSLVNSGDSLGSLGNNTSSGPVAPTVLKAQAVGTSLAGGLQSIIPGFTSI